MILIAAFMKVHQFVQNLCFNDSISQTQVFYSPKDKMFFCHITINHAVGLTGDAA
jgi:glutathionyl-hydroquinone reductase